MATGRIRRRVERGSGRQGSTDDRGSQQGDNVTVGSDVRQQSRGAEDLEDPRVRTRCDGGSSRQAARLGRVGGLGGRPEAPRQVPARAAAVAGQVQLHRRLLRPLRPGLRPHAERLRPRECARHRQVPRLHRRGGRPLHEVQRLALRRTWRWAGPSRAAAEDVRRGARWSLPRVQGALGSGVEDESREGGHAVLRHREPAARRRLSPLGSADALPVSGRRRKVLAGGAAVRGSRGVPEHGPRHDVPQLHGHA